MGFAVPKTGQINVNKQLLSQIDPTYWRSHISYFPQTPWLPYGSVRDALLMGKQDAKDAELVDVLNLVGLSSVNAMDLPNGLDTKVSASSGLSMGQRRRIALARAILQDRPIFILDEPTASLDESTEAIVNQAITQLVKNGKCVIAVAHRPHLVLAADQVIEIIEPQYLGVGS